MQAHFPNTPASQSDIVDVEQRCGAQLPRALREIWLHMNGVCFFDPVDPPYRLMPADEIVRVADYFRVSEKRIERWYIIIDVNDSNFIAADVGTQGAQGDSCVPCYDIFHENSPRFATSKQIADSIEELVESVLASEGQPFWL